MTVPVIRARGRQSQIISGYLLSLEPQWETPKSAVI